MDSYSKQAIVKGIANHRRIDVLALLSSNPDLSVEEIAEACAVDYKTIAVHLRKMTAAGLIAKKSYGRRVEHRITDRGSYALEFLKHLT